MSEIGIIVVTYNSAAVIERCLEAALRSGSEIVVVDNASSDSTVAKAVCFPVRVVANPINRGFAAAINQGAEILTTPYIVFLNPDVVLCTSLQALRNACDLPRSAGAGGLLLDESRQPQIGFMVRRLPTPASFILESLLLNRVWPANPVNRRYRALGLDYSCRQVVEQPAGAFLMIRRAVWEELRGLDERFWPLWFEDVDFCERVAKRGYLLYFEPLAVANHTGGHSIPSLGLEMRRVYWYRSLLRYAAKHFSPMGLYAVCVAVIIGSCIRAIVESALERSFEPVSVYSRVARLAGEFLFGRQDQVSLSF